MTQHDELIFIYERRKDSIKRSANITSEVSAEQGKWGSKPKEESPTLFHEIHRI